jgi:predicted patatin/cPLA2 family phospholipase
MTIARMQYKQEKNNKSISLQLLVLQTLLILVTTHVLSYNKQVQDEVDQQNSAMDAIMNLYKENKPRSCNIPNN